MRTTRERVRGLDRLILSLSSKEIASIEGALTRDAEATRTMLGNVGDSLDPAYIADIRASADLLDRVAEFLQPLSEITIETIVE